MKNTSQNLCPLLVSIFSFMLLPLQAIYPQVITLKNEGQVIFTPLELVKTGQAYFIKNKATQKVLEVKNGSNTAGTEVSQAVLNGKIAQKFSFENAGEAGYFFIRTLTGGHRLTLFVEPNSTALIPPTKLIQDVPYTGTTGNKTPDAQKWKIQFGSEPGAVLISAKLSGDFVLRAGGAGSNTVSALVKDGSDSEKWVLKITTIEDNPNSNDANKGLVVECDAKIKAMFLGVNWETTDISIGEILPEWRGVGENGTQKNPLSVHRVLEGVINKKDAKVTFEDLPSTHFTHDFFFHVAPDPAFRYLLGIQNGSVQEDIEVEWESGLGQNDFFNPLAAPSNKFEPSNPAVVPNIAGNSFGFYSEGHKKRKVIWNWPTHNDWVHVEGQWVWDRGHPPAKTEIHPPRLVAIKRNLPDKFDLGAGKFVFATRCDVFANGDGNVIWNNKGIHPFANKVEMSDRDYVIVFRHDLPRPSPNAKLKALWQDQEGNTFALKPTPVVNENGTADVPQPHVVVTIPWQTSRVSDKAVFARTLFIYWDDVPKHGIPDNFKIKEVEVNMNKIVILDKSEGGDSDPGEYRIFADVGGQWIFLNEFAGVDNILKKGLGMAWDTKYSKEHMVPGGPLGQQPFPIPDGAESTFTFNQNFYVYVPEGKEFRVHTSGWEADYVNGHFGRVIDPYISCTEGKKFIESRVDGKKMLDGGCLDDPIGNVTEIFHFNRLVSTGVTNTAVNNFSEEPGPCSDAQAKARYEAHFQLRSKKVGEKGATFKVTLQQIKCTSANDNDNPNETEEPYGKLAVYLSSPKLNEAKNEFLGTDFLGVIPNGANNFIFDKNADQNLSLKKGDVKNLGESRVYTFSPTDDPNAVFIVWGDMKEDDGDDDHDKLQSEPIKVKLSELVQKKRMTFVQKIGANKTQFEATYLFEQIQD